jgi:pilus assembly protein Flp/PilA
MKRLIERLSNDDRGLTAVEYGLIALVILVGIVVSIQILGNVVKTSFNTVGSAINTTAP